jgi:hypothetical protein
MMVAVNWRASRWEPETDDKYKEALRDLTARYTEWAGGEREIPEVLLHYKWRYVDGHLTRWTRGSLEQIYLELYPAKVVAEIAEIDEILDMARSFLTFLGETELLDEESEAPEVLVAHLEGIAPRFRSYMADVSRYSVGKRFTMAALAEGVGLDDQDELEAFMARFNARPRAEREQLMGEGRRPPAASSGRFTPPGTPPRPSSSKRRKRRR